MKETLTLKHPILVENKKIKELEYDFEQLDVYDMMEAFSTAHPVGSPSVTLVAEYDILYQFEMFCQAVIKAQDHLERMDVKRIRGIDARKAMELGRAFLLGADEEEETDGEETGSEKPSPNSALN